MLVHQDTVTTLRESSKRLDELRALISKLRNLSKDDDSVKMEHCLTTMKSLFQELTELITRQGIPILYIVFTIQEYKISRSSRFTGTTTGYIKDFKLWH